MAREAGIHWAAIAGSAVLCEAVLMAVAAVLRPFGQEPVTVAAVVGSFVLPLVFAMWVGSRSQSRFVLQGFLIGLVAMLIYLGLLGAVRAFGPPEPAQPFAYEVAHVLKLLGGAIGGLIAARQARRPAQMGHAA